MPPDQLVLCKSRRQRLAEMFIMPIAVLPIGPALRTLLGDRYDIFYGFIAIMLATLIMSRLSSQWAARNGGQWVTKAERLRRLVAESAETPRWRTALTAAAASALSMLGLLLVFEPINHLGEVLGAPSYTFGAVAAIAVLGGLGALRASRSPTQPMIVDEPPPSGHFWTQLRAVLPLTYAAYGLAAVAAYVIAVQVQPGMQTAAFIVTFLIASQLPLMLLRPKQKRIYPVALDARLGQQVAAGILLWGIPMGMMFSAGMALDSIGRPLEIAIKIAFVLPGSAIAGAAFGLLVYATRRLSEARKPQ